MCAKPTTPTNKQQAKSKSQRKTNPIQEEEEQQSMVQI
jgi:hypothetical protein